MGKLGDYFHFHSGTGYLNNAGSTTSGLHMPDHGGAVDKDRHCSLWTLEAFDAPIDEAEVPSGFYRIMHTASGRYLSAPTTLPTAKVTSDYYATFTNPGAEQTGDAHTDIWYIENHGIDASDAAHANEYIYKIWCFQSGYGLSCHSNPGVFGSFSNDYCPRLYSLVNTDGENYTIAGHYYDNVQSVAKNKFGLNNATGAITTKNPLKPADDTYQKLSRTGSAGDKQSQWKLYPVDDITKTVSIGSIGVATFAFTSDTSIPEGVVAYSATAKDEDCISLVKVNSETIPARQGVILRKTDEGKQNFIFTAVHGIGTPIEGNLLKGTLVETPLEVGDYILAKKKVDGEETEELVFGRISEASNIAAGKAFLPKDAVQARGFYPISWGDMETSVEEIPIMMDDASNNGLYIIDGQILIVRDGVKYNAKGQRVK